MDIHDARVVVTGGAGFIGSHVVDQLVDAGNHVVVIDDFSIGSRANLARHEGDDRVDVVEADICDQASMMDLVKGDVVIHMAISCLRVSLNRPLLSHDVNSGGSLFVALAAQHNDVRRLVYVSSSEAYGSARGGLIDEDHPLEPTTVYGASKAAGELYSQAVRRTYGTDVTIVRPFNSYGPREHAEGMSAEVIPKFVMRAFAGHAPVVFGDGQQTRDFTWVEDTARGILLAAACDEAVGEAVNIAYGAEVSIAEICRLVLAAVGRPDLQPVLDEDRPGDVRRHAADITKATKLFGFTPTIGIEEGIERYVAWVREQQPDVQAWVDREQVRNW